MSFASRCTCGRLAAAVFMPVLIALTMACGGNGKMPPAADAQAPPATATPRPIPSPVAYQPEPQGIELADPAFEALPGAQAEFGRLGGSVYQIEVPDAWNGRLVLYMHGFQGLSPKGEVDTPELRQYLIRHGIAWGASSFSSTALIPGRGADETAALWDHFVALHGRPAYTYITGHSMGGAATNIAAERYGDRYDGALSMCGYAGQSAQSNIVGDYFFAGAYAAGVTQAEFDASTDFYQIMNERVRTALADPAKRRLFENILIDITGGPRPFDRQGFAAEENTNWMRAAILVPFHLSFNSDRTYRLSAAVAVSSADFNRDVIRVKPDSTKVDNFIAGNEITGALQMPMLTLHTTGDWQVPIDEEQMLRRKVDAAGKGDLLVQRAVQAAPHCGFTEAEWERGMEDLIAWVEKGRKPDGEDLLTGDLTRAGAQFTIAPRFGSDAAAVVPGASERVTLSGAAKIDGKPLEDGFIWVEVARDGLRQSCSYPGGGVVHGQYALTVAGEGESRGCGASGASVYLVTYRDGNVLFSQPVGWPASGHEVTLNANFSTTASATPGNATRLFGSVYDAAGERLPPGTMIEAYAGEAKCGVASMPQAVMTFSNPDGFSMIVAGPDGVPACAKDAPLSFRVNGTPVAQTATNTLQPGNPPVTLVAP